MSDTLYSTYWYRIRGLKPLLRGSAKVSRHAYRGQLWYVIRNILSSGNFRFNASSYQLISAMNGQHTVEEIWEKACSNPKGQAPTQNEVIRLLGQLHSADLIQNDILPSAEMILDQNHSQQSHKTIRNNSNPFFMKFPLWDPDQFLQRFRCFIDPLLSRWMLAVWIMIISSAIVLSVPYWPELRTQMTQQVISPKYLFILWLTYPFVKILHELGHAFATKKWGGEVHEVGIALLVFTPIPYVEASYSAAFPEKNKRISVAAMGMAVELLLTSLALFIWLNVEAGVISVIAINVILIGGVSTLLFNGNPLLRFDGYFILADLIEIPNLKQRSTYYLGYLIQKYICGIDNLHHPETAPGEKIWFCLYGPLSYIYQIVLFAGIALFLSDRYFGLGLIVALWGIFKVLIIPAVKNVAKLINSPAAQSKRLRIIATGSTVIMVTFLFIFLFPAPYWTNAHGVVWLPEQCAVRSGTDCEISEVLVDSKQQVEVSTPLIKAKNPVLEAELAIHTAQLKELYADYNSQPLAERVKRKIIRDDIKRVKTDLEQVKTEQEQLTITSPRQGQFIALQNNNLEGRFVHQGELLGYIISTHRPTIRTAVSQDDFSTIREQTKRVQVRLADQSAKSLQAEIKRIVPAASINLPTPALGTLGGGMIPTDPTDPDRLRALDTVFQIDLLLPQDITNPHIGSRVYIKFNHGTMPLAFQWYRGLRQLLLRKFYV
jgi:putative peptide zinc metalloprotease protein